MDWGRFKKNDREGRRGGRGSKRKALQTSELRSTEVVNGHWAACYLTCYMGLKQLQRGCSVGAEWVKRGCSVGVTPEHQLKFSAQNLLVHPSRNTNAAISFKPPPQTLGSSFFVTAKCRVASLILIYRGHERQSLHVLTQMKSRHIVP